ncbi:hypothetical protein [Streptomyces griseoruber]|uniref:Uncharacterized protein n=1 Tax=Streptomyces griseoruber TaxID=1943 RepID=A0A117RBE5_9ACTN|nr:hypothetical protein [Streptomyces griseoruber]KUN81401.1 hypothetical protein AQJ64_23775 [Streptomyces griseoruber]
MAAPKISGVDRTQQVAPRLERLLCDDVERHVEVIGSRLEPAAGDVLSDGKSSLAAANALTLDVDRSRAAAEPSSLSSRRRDREGVTGSKPRCGDPGSGEKMRLWMMNRTR